MTSPHSTASAAAAARLPLAAPPASAAAVARLPLADFRADPRVSMLAGMALVIGTGGALASWVLVRLIALVTNVVWFGRLDAAPRSPALATPGEWMVAAPVPGGLVIGLMARFGSEKIRGHGIPEAIKAILIGGSRMSPKVAVLKPISSAISIGTGGPFGSLFAQLFHLRAVERKTLRGAGAAAGMTGTGSARLPVDEAAARRRSVAVRAPLARRRRGPAARPGLRPRVSVVRFNPRGRMM